MYCSILITYVVSKGQSVEKRSVCHWVTFLFFIVYITNTWYCARIVISHWGWQHRGLWPVCGVQILFSTSAFGIDQSVNMERSLFENAFIFGLNVAGWLWGVITFLPWYYLGGRKTLSGKTKYQAKPTSGPGSPYRCVEHFDSLMTSIHDGVTTMDQLFR